MSAMMSVVSVMMAVVEEERNEDRRIHDWRRRVDRLRNVYWLRNIDGVGMEVLVFAQGRRHGSVGGDDGGRVYHGRRNIGLLDIDPSERRSGEYRRRQCGQDEKCSFHCYLLRFD